MYLLSLFLCCFILARAQEPQATADTRPKITVEQIIIQTVINQSAVLDPLQDVSFGDELVAQLNNADNTHFKKQFAELPLRARLMYLLSVNIDAYEAFLDRYSDEEWTDMWLHLPAPEQKHIPKTRTEQLLLIRDTYYTYLEQRSSFFYRYRHPKEPHPGDLRTFKEQFHVDDTVITQANDMEAFARITKKEFIEAYLLRKRLALFNL